MFFETNFFKIYYEKYGNKKKSIIDRIAKSEEGIMKAEVMLNALSDERWNWIIQGKIEGQERDIRSGLANAEERGRKEGISIGEKQGMDAKAISNARNLLAMKREVDEKNRQLLNLEIMIGAPAMIAGLVLCGVAAYVEMPAGLRAGLIVFAVAMIVTVAFIAVGIEQKAGYYECQKCHDRHVPTYWQTNLAPHLGRKRYMKCPACGKWSYQKKVLTKEVSDDDNTDK